MALIKYLAPFRLYFMLAGAALLFASGWKIRDWQCDAATANSLNKAIKATAAGQTAVNDASAKYETIKQDLANAQNTERTIVREIYRTVTVDPGCAVPATASSLLNDATDRANAAATGQPIAALPTSE